MSPSESRAAPDDRPTIVVPDPSLVLLVGAAGAGKTTFATLRFAPDEVRSSDALREAVTGDATDQSRNRLVFALLHRDVERRLGAGLLTVVDATNVEWHARRPLLEIARRAGRPCVAIVLDLPLAELLARNASRGDAAVPPAAVERQHRRLADALGRDALAREGYAAIHRLAAADVERAVVVRLRPGDPPVDSPPPVGSPPPVSSPPPQA